MEDKDKTLKLPKFPELLDYNTESFLDGQQITDLNEALINAVLELRGLSKRLDQLSRKKVEADLIFKHKYREFILSEEGKESTKKILAELHCEKEQIEVLYLDEYIKEINRKITNLRGEIDTIKTIGNNIRLELKL